MENASQDTGESGLLNISEGERGELRTIVRDTSHGARGQAIRDFWSRVKENRTAPKEGAEGQPAPADARTNPGADPGADQQATGKASDVQQIDAILSERTDGKLTPVHMEVLGKATGPVSRRLDLLHRTAGTEALMAEVYRLEETTLKTVYRGSESEMAAGMKDIVQAAEKLGGQALIDTINASHVLADPDVHRRVLVMARSVLGKL